MDEKKPENSERPGPLTRLVEEEMAEPVADPTDLEQIRHRQTRVEPRTDDPDYSKGTTEHDDDREV
ncbi:MAG: hypothetical protein LC753_16275 [Acidobacteria bacterium]|nr:hypothetical protein [Acidobacteriota bacterium]MCA1651751.1 hypothetical protein [Acidobacteriota bacterium]